MTDSKQVGGISMAEIEASVSAFRNAAAAVGIAMARFSPAAMQLAAEVRSAQMRLLAAAGPGADGQLIAAEVEHRRAHLGMTPLAAVESVYEDVAAARWRP